MPLDWKQQLAEKFKALEVAAVEVKAREAGNVSLDLHGSQDAEVEPLGPRFSIDPETGQEYFYKVDR